MSVKLIQPNGGLLLAGGGLIAPGGGLVGVPAASAGYTVNTLTAADIATLTGEAEPTLMWLFNEATGATEIISGGSGNLTDADTPVKQSSDATLGGDTTVLNSTLDGMVAGANTVGDIAVETVTIMIILRFTTAHSSSGIMGKRDAGGSNIGWSLEGTPTGALFWVVDSASGATGKTLAVDHGTTNAQVIVATRQSGTNNTGVYSREGSTTGPRYNETLTNTDILDIGKHIVNACPGAYAAAMLWKGTDGDFSNFETSRSGVAVGLGYE